MDLTLEKNNQPARKQFQPLQFALWLGLVSIIMIFAALTSAYIVKRADTNTWLQFKIPSVFIFSTITIMASSLTLVLARRALNQGKQNLYANLLSITFILGCLFVVLQYLGWQHLYNIGLYLQTNPSSSFLFVITILHVLHVSVGLIILLITVFRAYRWQADPVNELKDDLRILNRKEKLKLTSTYWHFVDILWIYLFFFFLINQ